MFLAQFSSYLAAVLLLCLNPFSSSHWRIVSFTHRATTTTLPDCCGITTHYNDALRTPTPPSPHASCTRDLPLWGMHVIENTGKEEGETQMLLQMLPYRIFFVCYNVQGISLGV